MRRWQRQLQTCTVVDSIFCSMLSTISPCSCTIVARSWESEIPHNLDTLGRTLTLKMVFTSTISDSSWRMLCSRCSSWPILSSSSIISWVLWRKGLASQLTKNVNCKEIIVIYTNGEYRRPRLPLLLLLLPRPSQRPAVVILFRRRKTLENVSSISSRLRWAEWPLRGK